MRRIRILLLAALVAACEQVPTDVTVPLDVEPQFARAGGHRLVMVRAVPAQPGNAGAPVVNNLNDAVAAVAAGGTIRVFPGTWPAENVVVDKPIIIEGAGNGAAVIRTETGPHGLHVVTGGSLALRDLEFENESAASFNASVRVSGDGSTVDALRTAFRTGPDGFSGLYFFDFVPGSSLSVEHSSFTGGGYGLIAAAPTVEVRESRFSTQRWISLYLSGNGTIEGNTMTDCGSNACIYAVGGATGTISGNTLSNALTGPGPMDEGEGIPPYAFFHHVILVSQGSDVAITGNDIDGCGWGQCITLAENGRATVEGNTITAYQAQGTRIGIVAGDGAGGSAGDPARASHAVVRDNVFVGIGSPADRNDLNQYGFRVAALLAEGVGSTLHAEGNTISNAARGLVAGGDGSVSGSGNALDLLFSGVSTWNGDNRAELHGNDFVDYVVAMEHFGSSDSSLTCNWWDSAAGPQNPGIHNGQGSSLYTPWATSPIAATGQTTGCTGGL